MAETPDKHDMTQLTTCLVRLWVGHLLLHGSLLQKPLLLELILLPRIGLQLLLHLPVVDVGDVLLRNGNCWNGYLQGKAG